MAARLSDGRQARLSAIRDGLFFPARLGQAPALTFEGDSMRKQKAPPLLTGAENGEINRK
ncbi:hypothetical protein [Mesorhizobium sp.]|uniref:hypothetical protein n=1 Tax=Mesorhizobium sp. TaxID=1871066 RepID=UPI0025C61AAA|nr:hypothetical protein [Mesorhizobium sp.]